MNLTMKSLTVPLFYLFGPKFFKFDSRAMLALSSHSHLQSCWGRGCSARGRVLPGDGGDPLRDSGCPAGPPSFWHRHPHGPSSPSP